MVDQAQMIERPIMAPRHLRGMNAVGGVVHAEEAHRADASPP